MPTSASDGMWAAIGAAVVAALHQLPRIFRPRKPKPTKPDLLAAEHSRLDEAWARLDDEKRKLLAEVRDELTECRERSDELEGMLRAERLRTQIVIRALQEHGIPVPDAALLDVDFDPATGVYKLREVA